MNGASNCPECGSRMSIKSTNHGGGITFRVAECDCGERWELEERRARRLPPCTAVHSRRQLSTDVEAHPPTPTDASPPVSAGGVRGGLPSGTTTADSDPNPKASLLSEPRARARNKRDAEYTPAFERVWIGCDRQGHKEMAARAYVEQGRPDPDIVLAAWKAYRASLPSWRSPKDVSSWLRIKGHLQVYEPAAPEPEKTNGATPFAVREEQERRARRIEAMSKLAFGGDR